MPPSAAAESSPIDDAELRRLAAEEGWPVTARYNRLVTGFAMGSVLLGWGADIFDVGFSTLAWELFGLRIVAAVSALPLFLTTFAPKPPVSLERVKHLFLAGFPAALIAILALHPVRLSTQGWVMVVTWALLQLVVFGRPGPKVWIGLGTLVLFVVHLYIAASRLGDVHGVLGDSLPVLFCAAAAVIVLPWVPHRMEEQRKRELVARRRLEREIELRREHEHALESAKEAAQRATRSANAQKARADAAAEEARQAAKQTEDEARRRSELFANMSHDLRTPMAGILGLVDLMRGTQLTEEQSGYVETIRASNQTLLSLLNDVIDFARIEDGKLPLSPVPTPLAEALRAPADLLRVTADRKGLTLRVEIADGLPRHARIDSVRVQQIVFNLLGNALKFTERGGVTLRVSVKDWVERRGVLRVEVEDTGIGFSAEQRERMFQRFRQAEDSTSSRFGGSGLGLSICKGLVTLMSGTIGAESMPGNGSRFWFEIPIEETASPSGGEGMAVVPPMRVLLAEDNAVNQMVIGLMLKKLGQTISVASDGRQALRLLSDQRFDMAIMDMQMPVIDGDEVTRRLRSLSGVASMTYIVALTASVTPEQQARYRAAGVDAVYTKPIDLEGLRRLLAKEGPSALVRSGARRAAQRG